jgi:hypothetical protein
VIDSSTKTFVELKYFTPFDINNIPSVVLNTVYKEALGHSYSSQPLSLRQLLDAIVDPIELQNGIRKELIKYHDKLNT